MNNAVEWKRQVKKEVQSDTDSKIYFDLLSIIEKNGHSISKEYI